MENQTKEKEKGMTARQLYEQAEKQGAEDFDLQFVLQQVDESASWGISVTYFKIDGLDVGFSSKIMNISLEKK